MTTKINLGKNPLQIEFGSANERAILKVKAELDDDIGVLEIYVEHKTKTYGQFRSGIKLTDSYWGDKGCTKITVPLSFPNEYYPPYD